MGPVRRLALIGIGVTVLSLGAVVAQAQSLEGGCGVTANTPLDATIMTDATRDDPFLIDPEGSISWDANSSGPIMNHTWVINVDISGLAVPVARGADPNTDGTVSSVGSRSIPELVEQAKASGVPNAELLAGLRGIYRVFGNITGQGGNCFGDAYIKIVGNPLTQTPGQIGAAITALGALMLLGSGVAKK